MRAVLANFVQMRRRAVQSMDQFRKNDSGATAIEYGLIAALIVIAIIAAVKSFGETTNEMYNEIETEINTAIN